MSDVMKPWRCPSGHTLGMVNRNGSGIRRLLLYRQAVEGVDGRPQEGQTRGGSTHGSTPTSPTDPTEVDVIAIVEGYVADVRCSLCGRIRTWVPGEEAMRHLLSQAEQFKKELYITKKIGD